MRQRRFRNKKAEILTEQVIFIILNIAFFAILLSFIYIQGDSVHWAEEDTAKQIALLIDAARPGTEIKVNVEDFIKKAGKKGVNEQQAIFIDKEKNIVRVKGDVDSFYEYIFFNDVKVSYSVVGGNLNLKIE